MCECAAICRSILLAGMSDYTAFLACLKSTPALSEVKVSAPYPPDSLQESWYKCQHCKTVWRLVQPDPPFPGLWQRASSVLSPGQSRAY